MKVLVTGANGFIGSHVTRLLLSKGHQVCALLRPDSNNDRLADLRTELHVVSGDLNQIDLIRDQLRAVCPEVCFHLAWYTEPGLYWQSLENIRMVHASLSLIEHLLASGCSKIVAAGTCGEYKALLRNVSESSPVDPARSIYSACKLAVKQVAEHLAVHYGGSLVWGRVFYLYGPMEDRRRLIPSAITALLSDQSFRVESATALRDFLHVEDVASAVVHLAETGSEGCFNIGSGATISIGDMVSEIGEILQRPELVQIETRAPDLDNPDCVCANNEKLLATGWTREHSVREGLRQTVEWWRSQIYSPVVSPLNAS